MITQTALAAAAAPAGNNHLIVTHQTTASDALVQAAREIAVRDPKAEFTLIIPAVPMARGLTWTEGESFAVAARALRLGRAALEQAGLKVATAFVGDESPVEAIADILLRDGPYATIIVSTPSSSFFRWLKLDVESRVRRRFSLPVLSVIAPRDQCGIASSANIAMRTGVRPL